MLIGAIEAGGTKTVLAVGTGPDDIRATARVATTTPDAVARAMLDFFREHPVDAFGVGSFGPVRLDPAAPDYGRLLATPKPGWSGASFIAPLAEAFGVPIALDTDVNAAAVGEHRHGAARGARVAAYMTIGTGIGVGILVDGKPLHGALHPEFGHIRLARAVDDRAFSGACPYHGDCFEGLAAGPAIKARWGTSLDQLGPGEQAQVADYIGQGCAALVLSISAERIVIGGGVTGVPGLREAAAERMRRWLGGYLQDLAPDILVAPGLDDRAGLIGALELGRDCLAAASSRA